MPLGRSPSKPPRRARVCSRFPPNVAVSSYLSMLHEREACTSTHRLNNCTRIAHSPGPINHQPPCCGADRGKSNFHEKALFVKADVAAPLRGRAPRLCVLRAMLPSALSLSPRSSVARCIVRSIFSDYREGAAIFGSVSVLLLERGGWTKFALRSRLVLEIRSAFGHTQKPCVSL